MGEDKYGENLYFTNNKIIERDDGVTPINGWTSADDDCCWMGVELRMDNYVIIPKEMYNDYVMIDGVLEERKRISLAQMQDADFDRLQRKRATDMLRGKKDA